MALTDYFDREADRFASHYDGDRRFRERAEVWAALIARYAGDARSCLDLGCGPGVLARAAASQGLKTLAIDLAPRMIARIRQDDHLQARVGDFVTEELAPADLVLCSSVLEYAPDLERAIVRVASLVRDGGTVLASLPNPRSLYRRAEQLSFRLTGRPGYRRYVTSPVSLDRGRRLFAGQGLSCRELVYFARFAPLLPDALAANLAVLVLDKRSNRSTTAWATSPSS